MQSPKRFTATQQRTKEDLPVRELLSGNLLVVGSVDLKAVAFEIDPSGNIIWAKKYENGYDQMEVWSFDYRH